MKVKIELDDKDTADTIALVERLVMALERLVERLEVEEDDGEWDAGKGMPMWSSSRTSYKHRRKEAGRLVLSNVPTFRESYIKRASLEGRW